MSRIGTKPITLPDSVNLEIDGRQLTVKGPKGELSLKLHKATSIKQTDNQLELSISDPKHKSVYGLDRARLASAIEGVGQGYSRKLEIHGVGYRANLQGKEIVLNLGRSHDEKYQLPEGVEAAIEQNIITLTGADKQQVGQVAAAIRAMRPPEPYKGKGVRYANEYIIRKSGKAAVAGKE